MPRKRIKSTFDLIRGMRALVWVFAPILIGLGVVLLVQGAFDTGRMRANIIQALKERTGQDVQIKGAISVRVLPRPVVYVEGIEISNPNSKSDNPEISVDLAVLHVSLFSILDEKPTVNGISLQKPVVTIQRAHDKTVHWGWLDVKLLKAIAVVDYENATWSIEAADGKIIYTNAATDQFTIISDIYVDGSAGVSPVLNGEAVIDGRNFNFVLDANAGEKPVAVGTQPFNFEISSGEGDVVALVGSMDFRGDVPKIEGAFSLKSDDIQAWIQPKYKNPSSENASSALLPVKLTGQWLQNGLAVEMKDGKFQGGNSAGSGSVSLNWSDGMPNIHVDMNMQALDYNKWSALFGNIFSKLPAQNDTRKVDDEEGNLDNPLPQNMRMLVYMDVDKLIWGTQTLQQTKIQAALADGAVTVNQFEVALPGDAALTLFGVISPGNTGGLRFEGSMEMQGKSLRKMLTLVDEAADGLPDASFGGFSIRSNIFVSPEQLRLSEADVKLNELQLSGGLVGYFDNQARVEADVRLKNINFDYFRNVWRDAHKGGGEDDYFLKFDKTLQFSWLQKLRASVDFRVAVDGFTMFEREGKSAVFRFFARDGEIGLYNIRLTYPEDDIDANISIHARGGQPTLNLVANMSQLDTAYFRPLPKEAGERNAVAKEEPPKKPMWTEDMVDVSWLDGIAATLDLTIGKLIHKENIINNLKFQGKLENSSLAFKNTSFSYWDGKCSASGLIYGGKVPGINISFTLYNIQLRDMLKSLIYHDNISGRASLTGTFAASGVNYLSWLNQADANVVFNGRGVNVEGVNLPGVVDAVKVSRTAADVFNNANLALAKGSTEFSVEGAINIKNAVAKTPGITLKSAVANGQLDGEIKLIPWKLDLSALFRFQAFSGDNPPTMMVQVAGPLEAPQMRSDTSSLEAYVAKKIIGH